MRGILLTVVVASLFISARALKGAIEPSGVPDFLVSATIAKSDDLCVVLGQQVTLRGRFSLRGKLSPLVLVHGTPVYLIPRGEFRWGKSHAEMEGREVILAGTLRFHKSPTGDPDSTAGRAPDHYYMEAESSAIQAVVSR